MGSPVVHFEIVGKDRKALESFYHNLFGWKIESMDAMNYGLVTAEEHGIAGGITTMNDQTAVTFYAQVPDSDATLATVKANGGTVLVPTTVVPDMVTFALFADPEGNVVGLVQGS